MLFRRCLNLDGKLIRLIALTLSSQQLFHKEELIGGPNCFLIC